MYRNFNYSSNAWYFITICAQERGNIFGEIKHGRICVNPIGTTMHQTWFQIPEHFESVSIDRHIVMPDHVHGIIVINNFSVPRAGHARPLLPTIIGSFKSTSSKLIHLLGINFQWHRSFYDRIIRNEKELTAIRNYIEYNPRK
ncbi:MAG: transposase [Patescibacteria group bacterium]|jgi:REP element-mobilizing transposase RayT